MKKLSRALLSIGAVALLAAANSAMADTSTTELHITGQKYTLSTGEYVLGQDHQVYQWMGRMTDGKFALKPVATAGWLGRDPGTPTISSDLVTKDSGFVSEVEVKDCRELCQGNKVFQTGGAQMATVDRVFSGGTLTVHKATTNSIGIINGSVLMLTSARDVVRQDAFILSRTRGMAGGPR